MVIVVALYGKPLEERSFLAHYAAIHVPLVERLPGLRSYRHGRVVGGSRDDPSYWYAAQLTFRDRRTMDQALSSSEGQAAARDLASFATGGAELVFGDCVEV